MKLPVAFAVSLALHGAAIAYVLTKHAKPQEIASPVAAPPLQDVTPIELFDDHSGPGGSATAGATGGASRAIETGHSSHGTAERAKSEPPAHSPLMTMRKPKLEGVSGDFLARFMENTKPLAPKDTQSEQIAYDLARDRANLANPRWVANATPDELTAQRLQLLADRERDEAQILKPDGRGTKTEHPLTFTARADADGTAHFKDAKNLQIHSPFYATFDVSDAFMRDHGIDPYASAKRKWLEETRDERSAIARVHEQKQLHASAAIMQKNVARLFALARDARARKHGLFELWDDCAEVGSDDLVAGGKAARDYVVGVIRGELPSGSPDAYTAAELAELNAHRASRAPFAPYD